MPARGLTALGAAFAGWLSLGAVAVVTASTADRVAVLPPLWTLVVMAVFGLAAAWLIRAHPSSSLVWLPSLFPIVPWLPMIVPAAGLLWTGGLATLIWMTIGAAIFRYAVRSFPRIASSTVSAGQAIVTHPVRAPAIAATLVAAVYLFAAWQLSARLPAGDEPHYLVIADSLVRDGDLQIENNHRAHHYLAYFQGELKPDYLRRGANNQIYSIHAPGLPVLLLPVYAIAGYAGAVTLLALLSAAGSALAWRLCWTLTDNPAAAWFGWAVAALPVPVLFHATAIYPDGVGAVIVLTGAAALVHASRLTTTRAALHGAALALLPWLHTRFVLLAAALGVCVVARLATRPDRTRLARAFLAVPAVSAVAWFSYFYVVYGTLDPSAPYGTYTQSAVANIPVGLTGLLFDQQFGLLPNAPVYLIGLSGLGWLAFRTDTRRLPLELTAAIAPYVVASAMYGMWWGGSSAPARFITVVLPVLALPSALVWARATTRTTRASAAVALGVSVWLSAVLLLVDRGRLAYNDRDGFALWTDWANPGVDLAAALPSVFQTGWPGAIGRAAVWGAVLAIAWLALHAIERRRARGVGDDDDDRGTPFSLAVVPSVYALAIMIALTIVWRIGGVSGVRPDEGQVAVLRAAETSWWLRGGMTFGVPERMRIHSTTRRIPRERPLFFMPRLPAGRYRIVVEPTGTPDGRLAAFVGRAAAPLRAFDFAPAAKSDPPFDLVLPIGVESLSLRADDRARRSIRAIVLEPQRGDVDRLPGRMALQSTRYGDATVYTIRSATQTTYLEAGGFWVAPRVDADVLIESDRTDVTAMTLFMRNVPVANRVRLDVESWHRELTLDSNAEVSVDVPASHGGATPLRIRAAEGFRPSAGDPNNGDHRRLGVWIEVRAVR